MSTSNSGLTAATTPLTGTEVMYVVQGGNSRKATTGNLYIPGGTDVAVTDGGTGASTASAARTNLGLAIGTNVQAWDADLDAIAALTTTTFGRSLLTKTAAEDVRTTLASAPYVATRTALKALDTTKDTTAFLTEAGREGIFMWKAGDYSAQVAADTQEGVYVKATAIASASGAWVRVYSRLTVEMFGASASGTAAANATAIQVAVNVAQLYTGYLFFPALYPVNTTILVSNNIVLEGVSAFTSGITCNTGAAISLVPSTSISNNNTWYGIRYMSIISTDAGVHYGIEYASTGAEYLSNWELVGCYLSGTSGGASWDSTGSTVGIFSCTIRRNWFNNGMVIKDGGDSITILENTINGNGIGILVNLLKTGARQLVIRNNNITTLSECVYLISVTGAIIDSNWMETPSYLGSYTGTTNALLYAQASPNTRITRNTIQPLYSVMVGLGQTAANYSIRLNTSGAASRIADNDIAVGAVGHIQIGAGVTSTLIDWDNKFDVTAVVTDAGTGTFGTSNTPGIFNQAVKFTTTAAFGTPASFESTEAGAGNGPFVEVYRNSASPAVSDGIGTLAWYGNNASAAKINYQYIGGTLTNVTGGAEASTMNFATYNAGALAIAMSIGANITMSRGTLFAAVAAPSSNDGAALGNTSNQWSDLFLASGGVINFNNGNYTVTHTAGNLSFNGAVDFTGAVLPTVSGTPSLGSATKMWGGLFLKSLGVINFNNGDVTVTHSAGVLTFSGAVLSTGTGGVGYATGAGGAVTQATSRATGVTLNKASGAVTMFTAAGSATPASFTVTNSTVAATDTIILNIKSGASNTYFYFVTAVAAGSFVVTFWTTGGTASDTPVLNYNVVKGVAA
jgi:hypothetical protein